MPSFDVMLLRLLLAILVGGAIGAEREYRSKSAGFRTMILICLGSFLFTTISIYLTNNETDRIASNIVTGIGFLGAGVIYKGDGDVNGLTTAATIWATAALGMGIGAGYYHLVFLATVVILTSLFFFTKLEKIIDSVNQSHTYKIVSNYNPELLHTYEDLLRQNGLRFKRIKQTKVGDQITGLWHVQGTKKNHKKFVEQILHDSSVQLFEF